MNKKLRIFFMSIGGFFTIINSMAAGPNPLQTYLNNSGTPPSANIQACRTFCSQSGCQVGMTNKTYDCFRGCSQHGANLTISTCANTQFQGFLGDLHQKINGLKAKKHALNTQVNQLNTNIGTLHNRVTALQNQLHSVQQQNRELRDRLTHLSNRVAQLERERDALMAQNTELENKLRNAEEAISERGVDVASLLRELDANQQEIKRLENELEDLSGLLAQIMQDYGDVVGKYVLLGNFINTAADRVRHSENEMHRVAQEFAAALSQDREAIDAWVQKNRADLKKVQADYRRRSQEYAQFIENALQLLESHGQNIHEDIQKLIDSYEK